MYKNLINVLLGLILVATPFINLSSPMLAWLVGIVGAVIVAESLWGIIMDESEHLPTMKEQRRV